MFVWWYCRVALQVLRRRRREAMSLLGLEYLSSSPSESEGDDDEDDDENGPPSKKKSRQTATVHESHAEARAAVSAAEKSPANSPVPAPAPAVPPAFVLPSAGAVLSGGAAAAPTSRSGSRVVAAVKQPAVPRQQGPASASAAGLQSAAGMMVPPQMRRPNIPTEERSLWSTDKTIKAAQRKSSTAATQSPAKSGKQP